MKLGRQSIDGPLCARSSEGESGDRLASIHSAPRERRISNPGVAGSSPAGRIPTQVWARGRAVECTRFIIAENVCKHVP